MGLRGRLLGAGRQLLQIRRDLRGSNSFLDTGCGDLLPVLGKLGRLGALGGGRLSGRHGNKFGSFNTSKSEAKVSLSLKKIYQSSLLFESLKEMIPILMNVKVEHSIFAKIQQFLNAISVALKGTFDRLTFA